MINCDESLKTYEFMMMKVSRKIALLLVALIWLPEAIKAQETSDEFYSLSLEELMNIEIVSASKSKEKLFEAPVSSSVLTQEEIMRSGATSIPEALRLVPGIIVREQSNGNYDVHLRGFDNVPPESLFPLSANSITLVMINNRVVYNYFAGGTFWETLPIDINDVDRIEVVRGASSPMYGPNAVAGVINIITKKYEEEGVIAQANTQVGSYGTTIANTNIGYNFGNGWTAFATGNLQKRDRLTTQYYDFSTDSYLDNIEDVTSITFGAPFSNPDERYPDVTNAMDKYGINGYVNYTSDDLTVDISGGHQDSEVQKVYVDVNATPLTTAVSNTDYIDLRSNYKGLNAQVSYLNGSQNTLGVFGWEYDFSTTEALLEYDWQATDDLIIRPGFNYRTVTYDGAFIGGKQNIATTAGSLYASYNATDRLRLVAAGRMDQYNVQDDPAFSYQFSATYNVNDKLLFRGVASKAFRAPFILDNFIFFQVTPAPTFRIDFLGNQDMELMSMNLYEFGLRAKPMENLSLDLEVFHANAENYSDVLNQGIVLEGTVAVNVNQYQNLELSSQQTGVTLSANFVPNENLQVKGFVTFQQSDVFDKRDSVAVDGTVFFEDIKNESTPSTYGGLFLNYNVNKWNFNVSSYFYGRQTFINDKNTDNINGKFLLNAKVDYKVLNQLSVFVNARNLLGNQDREFAFADVTGAMFLGGFSFSL